MLVHLNAIPMRPMCAGWREHTAIKPALGEKTRAPLAGRPGRSQTFVRMQDIETAFGREGRSGARIIRISALPATR